MTNEDKIHLISQKIILLSNDLDKYRHELDILKNELKALQGTGVSPVVNEIITHEIKTSEEKKLQIQHPVPGQKIVQPILQPKVQQPKKKSNLEEFIAGRIVSIIGITVLVIGLAIGVKYAIDENLINELSRVILGFASGGILLILALRLKNKFEVFSAIILSGGMATLYFTAFAGYSFYNLYPQIFAFVLMVAFTVFTVYAAIIYNMQVIAIIGLVGAYCVPFLLSDDSGKVKIMFSYMSIINAGILVLSFRKYWRVLTQFAYYSSWLIFVSWFSAKYDQNLHQNIAIFFSFIFFITFYINFISYKTIRKEKFNFYDIILLFSNSFIYYGIGYVIFDHIRDGMYLGIFTVANALVHFAFGINVYRNKQVDQKLFFLLIGLVLTFVTIAIPVQLDGSWVTLFWAMEIGLLFYFGRKYNVRFYEWLSFILILPALISLLMDWTTIYSGSIYNTRMAELWKYPLFNITFLTSAMMIVSLGSLIFIHKKNPLPAELENKFSIYSITEFAVPVLLLIVAYFSLFFEISNIFYLKIQQTAVTLKEGTATYVSNYDNIYYDYDLEKFRGLWLMNYTLIFFSAFARMAINKWKNVFITWVSYGLNLFVLLLFLITTLHVLGELRDSLVSPSYYYDHTRQDYFVKTDWYFNFRYVCFAFLILLGYFIYKIGKTDFIKNTFASKLNPVILHFAMLVILSNELTNLMILSHTDNPYHYAEVSYKVGYAVLWGLYSFALVALGIWRRQKFTRVSAIVLFGITLVKLAIYDTWDMSRLNQVIAYISIGVILLTVAFLYQKFKHVIFNDDEK